MRRQTPSRQRLGSALFRLVIASGLLMLILAAVWLFMLLTKIGPG